jgi:hypothetical protein
MTASVFMPYNSVVTLFQLNSLCALRVLCASVVSVLDQALTTADTEDTEGAQRINQLGIWTARENVA